MLKEEQGLIEWNWWWGYAMWRESWNKGMEESNRLFHLWPTRLLCPWNFLGENTGVGRHFLLQGFSWPRDGTPAGLSGLCSWHICLHFFWCVPRRGGAGSQDMCTQSGVLGTASLQNEWNSPPRISSPGELQFLLILVHKCDCQIFVFSFFKLSAWSWAPFSGSNDPVSPSVKSLSLSPTPPLRCPSPRDDSQQFVMCFAHHLFVNYMHSHVVFAACGLLSTLWKVFFVKPNFNFNVVSFLKVEGNEWVVLYVSYWKISMLCLMNIFFCITYKPLCFWICNSFVLINWISCKW